MKEAFRTLAEAVALAAFLALCGCSFAMRYPWDKQQDTHATQPPRAVPRPSPTATPTPSPTPEVTQ